MFNNVIKLNTFNFFFQETSDEEEDLDLDLNSEDSESTTETDSIDTNSTSGEDTREDLRVYRRVQC